MKIKVEQKHIDEGMPRMPGCCPIACALHDAGFEDARVGGSFVYLTEKDFSHGTHVSLPPEATDFIYYYDSEKAVEPFEFELDTENKHEIKS